MVTFLLDDDDEAPKICALQLHGQLPMKSPVERKIEILGKIFIVLQVPTEL
jgi:hypothetical protein